jgi:arsenate reductase (thioredoxin)
MAEGFARKLGLDAHSAGSKPSGKVNPTAIAIMAEKGVDLSRHVSKAVAQAGSSGWDYVVTMGCGDACPFVPSKAKLDWSIPDPKNMPLDDFRKVRDLIEAKVRELAG